MSVEIFQSPEWFAHFWKYGLEAIPYRYWLWKIETTQEDKCTCLPLVQHTFQGGLYSLSNYYSCLFGPEVTTDEAPLSTEAQWASAIKLLRSVPGSHSLRLHPLDSESQWIRSLEKNLRSNGFWTNQLFCFGNWYQKVTPEGFKKYWKERPSALSNTVRRGRNRLEAAGKWHTEINDSGISAEQLEKAIKVYENVYAGSWKKPEPCKDFMPGLMRLAASKGWLRLGILWLNNVPLAAQFWLVTANKANIYKLAYIKGAEKMSVGSVLTAAMMEHAMDVDKVLEVDYLSGDDGYKANWMAGRRERTELVAIDMKTPKGWLAAANTIPRIYGGALKKKLSKNKFNSKN